MTEEGRAAFPEFHAERVFGSFERPEWTGDKDGKVVRKTPAPRTYRQRLSAEVNGAADATVLARFTENHRPALVRRRRDGVIEYWIGSVMAPADLLRSIARQAGCHLYCDADEIVYANRSFLAIHAGEPGERTFALRRRCDVLDVPTGEVLAEGTDTFRAPVAAFQTRVFFTGRAKAWQRAERKAEEFHVRFQAELKRLREERTERGKIHAVSPAQPVEPGTSHALNRDYNERIARAISVGVLASTALVAVGRSSEWARTPFQPKRRLAVTGRMSRRRLILHEVPAPSGRRALPGTARHDDNRPTQTATRTRATFALRIWQSPCSPTSPAPAFPALRPDAEQNPMV